MYANIQTGGKQYRVAANDTVKVEKLDAEVGAKLSLDKSAAEAADLGIESAPLERLRGHLLSVAIPEGSKMHGVEINELRLPPGAAVTLVVRDGESFVPLPTTILQRGDELLVVATDPVRDAAERRLRAVGQGGKLAGWLGTGGNGTS